MQASGHIVVGISGGVDSAVAALLLKNSLKNAGTNISGLFMKNWEEDDTESQCMAEEDLAIAQSVCDQLDITLQSVNFSTEYWDDVFETFLSEYRAGRTPNPDILCNSQIKFRSFLEHAQSLGADKIATGHYARVTEADGQYTLRRSADAGKDQTYFLHQLDQSQLKYASFPLGDLNKDQVRELAKDARLVNHDRKDSTGICFIGERPFREFLARFLPQKTGEIQTIEGVTVGEHRGAFYYTLGQREGLGIGGNANAEHKPWYVVDKDIDKNILIVAQGHDHPRLHATTLTTESMHWICDETPDEWPLNCYAQARHRQPPQACQVALENDGIRVVFENSQRALTPGQSVVLYQDDVCLGGAPIDQVYTQGSTQSQGSTGSQGFTGAQ